MGMWPTATLTYGYDITSDIDADWAQDDEPVEAAGQVLADAGLPGNLGVWQDDDGCTMRLYAAFLSASGWNDKGTAESLELPDGTAEHLARAAELLGVDVGDAKPGWMLMGEFN